MLIWDQVGDIRLVISEVPIASSTFLLLLGDLKAFPGQTRCIIPPASSGASPSRTYRDISKKRCPEGILIRCMNNFSCCLLMLRAEALLCIHNLFFSVTSLTTMLGLERNLNQESCLLPEHLCHCNSVYIYK